MRKRAETCVVIVSSLLSQVEQVKSSLQGRQEAAKVSMQMLRTMCVHTYIPMWIHIRMYHSMYLFNAC